MEKLSPRPEQTETEPRTATGAARLCWEQEESGGFRHRESERFTGREKSGSNLGKRRNKDEGDGPESEMEPILED